MSCGCGKVRRPNAYDNQRTRQLVAPPVTYEWYVGSQKFDGVDEAKAYQLSMPINERLPITRKTV